MSKTVLDYFNSIYDAWFNEDGTTNEIDLEQDIYLPYTSDQDFTTEVALVPNTHPDFRPISSRAYYDSDWEEYKEMLADNGIDAISSFALVDP